MKLADLMEEQAQDEEFDARDFTLKMAVLSLSEKNKGLEAENAKLRELAETLWMAGDYSAFVGRVELAERLRELGIEVKDGTRDD